MEKIFEDCLVAVLVSKDNPAAQAAELVQRITQRHGEAVIVKDGGRIESLEDITHIISSTSDFPDYATARLTMIPVVTPSWVIQSLSKGKQAQMRPFTPDPALFFKDVVLTCADIPTGDKDAIAGAVLAMGGSESSSLTKLNTHICALTMEHPKVQTAQQKGFKCKIVLPHWFDDCLKLGKRIDEGPYTLPDPEIFRKNPEDSMPFPTTTSLNGAISSRPDYLPTPTDASVMRRLTVFKGKSIMLAEDLSLSSRLRGILEELIRGGGGQITESVHDADIYVCHLRQGREYIFASLAEIDVGNLSWLYYLITHNEWTSPYRRLLHYPLPPGGVDGFKNFKITLSNYGGEARIYLENLVIAAGGEFTKSMKQDNTHLITARRASEKCDAAEEWGINMVNHLWLEESYARCKLQPLTDSRYTHFPPRTNLGEIIGQTQLNQEVVRSLYFPKSPTPSPDDPKVIRKSVKRKGAPVAADGSTEDEAEDEAADEAEAEDEAMVESPKKKEAKKTPARPKAKATSANQMSTPLSRRTSTPATRRSLGKENDTPSSTRSAKDAALNRLHDLAPDIALYQKENKRKGNIWGGDRAATKAEKLRDAEKGGSSDNSDVSEEEDVAVPIRPSKKQKTGQATGVQVKLLITGYTEWLNNLDKEDREKKKLRELGILIVSDAKKCDHMAAPSILRTQKFLIGLAHGPTIISTNFIDTALKSKVLPNPKDFILDDKDTEKKFGLKLKDVVSRAKKNDRRLLAGCPIYCTAEIPHGWDTYRLIAEANGATFLLYRGRGGATIKPTKPEEDDGPPEPVYLMTGLTVAEKGLWPHFVEMAERGHMEPRIVTTEWLLDCALSQQLLWDKKKYLAKS